MAESRSSSRSKASVIAQPRKAPDTIQVGHIAPVNEAEKIGSSSLHAAFATAEQKVEVPQSTTESMQVATRVPDIKVGASSNALLEGRQRIQVEPEITDKPEAALPEAYRRTGHDLTRVFGHGRVQHMALYIGVLGQFSMLCHNLLPIIVAADVEHWCKQSARYSNLTTEQWRNISIPRDADGRWLRCVRYDPPLSVFSTNRSTVPCHSWDYAPNAGHSVITEWNLVCKSDWLVALSVILYKSGAMTAAALMGILSDKLGRRPVLCISVLVLLISGVALCFTNTYLTFVMLRFIVSASVSTVHIVGLVLLFELCPPVYRCMYIFGAVVGPITTAPIFLNRVAPIARKWTTVQALIMLPTSLLTSAFYMSAESPLWLLSKCKLGDLEKVVMWAASTNGVNVAEATRRWRFVSAVWRFSEMDAKNTSKSGTGYTTWTLLHGGVIVVWLNFLMILAYYARVLAGELLSVWQVVATVIFTIPLANCFYHSVISRGRRATLWGVLIGYSTIIASSTLILLFPVHSVLVALLNAVIDAFVYMLIVVTFFFSLELFPTEMRSWGAFVGYFFGRIGSLTAPVLFEAGFFSHTELASLTLSLVALLTALTVLYLPETMS